MITHEFLPDQHILILRPSGPLTQEDFANLTAAVDPVLDRLGGLDGLLIDAPEFPGWQDFAGLVSHIRFVKDHHRSIRRVAFVSDGTVLKRLPSLARHFVNAELRRFGQGQVEDALAWLADESVVPKSTPASLRYFQNDDPPAMWINVSGRVTKDDYLKLLGPMKEQIAGEKPVSMLIQMTEFEGAEMGALWEDLKFGIENIKHIRRMAVVTDKKWIDRLMNLMHPLLATELKAFPSQQEMEAWNWVIEPG